MAALDAAKGRTLASAKALLSRIREMVVLVQAVVILLECLRTRSLCTEALDELLQLCIELTCWREPCKAYQIVLFVSLNVFPSLCNLPCYVYLSCLGVSQGHAILPIFSVGRTDYNGMSTNGQVLLLSVNVC